MGEKSGETKKTTDWLGREKEEHFDSSGKKVGETKFTTDWRGNPKQEHYDTEGHKTGETRKGSDWLGRDRAEHHDSGGRKVGHSRDDTDWLGRDIQRHHDASGMEVGVTRRDTDWLGRHVKRHEGQYFKGQPISTPSSGGHGYSGDSSYSGHYSDTRVKKSNGVLSALLGLLILGGISLGIGGINSLSNKTENYSRQNERVKVERQIPRVPLDSLVEGRLAGYATILAGDPIVIRSHKPDGMLKWEEKISHGMGLAPKHLAPIDYNKDGHFDELLVEVSGSTTPAGVVNFGPKAYTFNFLIFDSNGNLVDRYQCGYLTSPMIGARFNAPKCTIEEATTIYRGKLQQYGYRNGGKFLDQSY